MTVHFTSGDWVVKEGHEDAFLRAFKASGTEDMDPPLRGLLRRPQLFENLKSPGHYRSYAEWESEEAVDEFRSRPDFGAMIAAMEEHLEEFSIFTGRKVV